MRRICVRHLTATALATAFLSPCVRAAGESGGGGDGSVFQLGLRAVYLDPQSSPLGPYSSISGKVYPEIEGEWFFGRNWSIELAIGAPTNFSTNAFDGAAIRLMPITWTAKYRFAPDSRLRPYLGVGLQYTQSSLEGGYASYTTLESSTAGVVAQAGLEFRASPTWYVNLDIRYLNGLEPSTGTAQSGFSGESVKIDPLLYSVGVAYRW
jgi:outer membrane protein